MIDAECPGCGMAVPAGPLVNAPGGPAAATCVALFGEALAASYLDPARRRVHQLIVDAYTTQHPGGASSREIQAVAICLMTLHLFVDRDTDPAYGPALHKVMVDSPVSFRWLEPPALRATPKVSAVVRVCTEDQYTAAVGSWAREVWAAWHPHHDTIRSWVAEIGDQKMWIGIGRG